MMPSNLPRLLIVDDEQYIGESLARDLKGRFNCILSRDFSTALEQLQQYSDFKIILVDESLSPPSADPESGLDILRVCQREYPFIVRCLMSGAMDLDKITSALENSLYHRFFFKPWEREFLVFQLTECLILEKALHEAKLDALTGLINRRGFSEQMEREMGRCQRHGRKLCLALWDLDHFKEINDKFGHLRGDEFLKSLAQLLKKSLRNIDYVARIGGDEFALILPETSHQEGESVLARVSSEVFSQLQASASIGLVEYRGQNESLDELLHRADQLLYRAKKLGRNRVEVQE